MDKLYRDLKTWCGVSETTVKRKKDSRYSLIYWGITICVLPLIALGIFVLLTDGKGLNSKEERIFKQDSSDAMLVDLNLLELAQTKGGVANKIIQYQSYSASYNKDWKIPNWVAYSLDASKLSGKIRRPSSFESEPLLCDDSVSAKDYVGSGYSKGHMAPAGDMKWSETAMKDCFYLCNICPQSSLLNCGLWLKLEMNVRKWAKKDTIFVCCGPIVSEHPEFIKNKIAIPDAFF